MNFKITVLLLFSFTLFLSSPTFSQDMDFDEKYLDSLPDEIKEDVMKEIESSRTKQTEKFPNKPSSQISNLEIIQDWERFKKSKEQSERYGMRLFRSMQTSFMPTNEPNFDDDYILNSGDILEIQIISQKTSIADVEINRDGSVNIQDVGKVFVSGLQLKDATSLIKSKVSSAIIGSDIYVSLKNIRDIKILITGHALFPGIYTLSGGSNLLNALNIAGGVSENGSFREIELKRDGNTIEKFDLYEMLLFGNLSYSKSLRSGDSIYINPVKNLVRTSGAFNIEAVFELKNNETLEDLVEYAGGLSKDSHGETLTLNRINNGSYMASDISKEELSEYVIQNNDSIYAKKSSYGTIEIVGQVKNPGKYSIGGNDTILSVIERAGGYLPNAYPYGSSLFTRKAKKIEEENFARFYNELVRFLVAAGPSANSQQSQGLSTAIPLLLADIKNTESTGRVQAEFDLVKIKSDLSKNTYLSDGDKILVPMYENIVYVYGAVASPGGYEFKSGTNPNYYIDKSGGYLKYAEKSNAILITPNGESELIQYAGLSFKTLTGDNLDVFPGSVIYVPRELGAVKGLSYATAWAPIVSSLALSIASLNAIND